MATAAELMVLIKGDSSGVKKATGDASKSLGSLGGHAKKAGIAIGAGLAVGAAGAAVALLKIGDDFEKAFNTIRVGTGATGEDLEALKGDFREVFKNVPADAGFVSQTLADLNTRIGVTGETAQKLTTQFAQLQKLGVDASVEGFTRAMGDWGLANEDASASLDKLFVISQATGPSIEEIQRLVVQFGAPMRNFGFSFEESAALLGKWQKEGVNTELVMGSLRIAAGGFADEGGDLRTGPARRRAGSCFLFPRRVGVQP